MSSVTCEAVASAGPSVAWLSGGDDIAVRERIAKYWQTRPRYPRLIFIHAERKVGKSNQAAFGRGSLVSDQSGDSFTSPTPFFVSFLSHSRAAHCPMLVLVA